MTASSDGPPLTPEAAAELARREAARERSQLATGGLLADLASAGHPVNRVWELVETSARYPDAIPVLCDWLGRIDDPVAQGWVVRALGKPWAKAAWPALVAEFSKTPDDTLRWEIGDSLAILWKHVPTSELVAIVGEPGWGAARMMPMKALAKKKDDEADAALAQAVADPEVGAHALELVRKRRVRVPRAVVESHLADSRPWARSEARRVLEMLDELDS